MRLIAFVNGHALAHVSRALEVSRELRHRGHEIIFAGGGKYLPIAAAEYFDVVELPFIDPEQMRAATTSGKLWQLFPEAQLRTYLEADLELIDRVRPDALLVDCRLTSATAGQLCDLPVISILNVHMTRYRSRPFADLRWTRMFGEAAERKLGLAMASVEDAFYDRFVVSKMATIRRELGLPRLHGQALEEGDLNLLADSPDFNPARPLPDNCHFIGPLTWCNRLPAPRCLPELDPNKKTIYVSIGSLGMEHLLESLSNAASQLEGDGLALGVQFVLATGDAKLAATPRPAPGVFVESFINTDKLLPHCSAVICHGGNGTLYQALAHALPIVAVPNHAEQRFGVLRLEELGLGRMVEASQIKRRGAAPLLSALGDVLSDTGYQSHAQAMAERLADRCAPMEAADRIELFMGHEKLEDSFIRALVAAERQAQSPSLRG